MAPFRPQRRAAEEEEEEEELDEDEEEEVLLAPGSHAPGDAPRAIVNVAGMSAALEDFAWPASVAWVDTLVVQVSRLVPPCAPNQRTGPVRLAHARTRVRSFRGLLSSRGRPWKRVQKRPPLAAAAGCLAASHASTARWAAPSCRETLPTCAS